MAAIGLTALLLAVIIIGRNTSKQEQSYNQQLFAMDTYMSLTAYGENAKEAVEASVEEIQRIEQLISIGFDSSEVSKLNQQGEGNASEDTQILLQKSMELWEKTDGVFDISIYPVMKLWGFADENYKVPKEDELRETLKLVDAGKISYDEGAHRISFEKKGMAIDFGGIGKGYTSNRVMEVFKEYGVKSGIINLGGNVQTLGSHTDQSKWNVAIKDPMHTEDMLGTLKIANQAVITSGGYERYFEENGKTYHHIIDPATGYPADSGILSATIISEDGMLADGLSTSLFIMGIDKATEYWRQSKETFDFIIEAKDGTLYVTEGIRDSFRTERNVISVQK